MVIWYSYRMLDCIIIGQGLAGSLLACELLNQNKKVLVFDNTHQQCATKVAAGIINPIIGPQLNTIYQDPQELLTVHHFYQDLEKQLDQTFSRFMPLKRSLTTKTERHHFQLKKIPQVTHST